MKPFPKKVLMIDTDIQTVETIRYHLSALPAVLISSSSGQDGLKQMVQQPLDLCILGSHSADISGIDVCRQIRQLDQTIPIIMLTNLAQETDKVNGLEAGADDYLTKPVGSAEFMARVRAILRRSNLSSLHGAISPLCIIQGGLTINTVTRLVSINGKRVELTPKEFDLLVLMAKHPGRSYRRKELLKQVWNYTNEGYEHTLTAHINRLRMKIEPDFRQPSYILTTWGIGYRFAESQ